MHIPDSPLDRDAGDHTSSETGGRPTPGTPRWVKVFGIVVLLLVVLVVVMLIAGGERHSPSRHGAFTEHPVRAPSSGVVQDRTTVADNPHNQAPPAVES